MSDERHWGREAVRRNREARARPRIVGAWAGTLAALGAALSTGCSSPSPIQCSSASDCAPGYGCSGGQCVGGAGGSGTSTDPNCAPIGHTLHPTAMREQPPGSSRCGQDTDGQPCYCQQGTQCFETAFATDASGTKPGGCSSFCVDATYATACGETSFGFFACVPGETCVAGADYWGCCAAGKSCGGVCE